MCLSHACKRGNRNRCRPDKRFFGCFTFYRLLSKTVWYDPQQVSTLSKSKRAPVCFTSLIVNMVKHSEKSRTHRKRIFACDVSNIFLFLRGTFKVARIKMAIRARMFM